MEWKPKDTHGGQARSSDVELLGEKLDEQELALQTGSLLCEKYSQLRNIWGKVSTARVSTVGDEPACHEGFVKKGTYWQRLSRCRLAEILGSSTAKAR